MSWGTVELEGVFGRGVQSLCGGATGVFEAEEIEAEELEAEEIGAGTVGVTVITTVVKMDTDVVGKSIRSRRSPTAEDVVTVAVAAARRADIATRFIFLVLGFLMMLVFFGLQGDGWWKGMFNGIPFYGASAKRAAVMTMNLRPRVNHWENQSCASCASFHLEYRTVCLFFSSLV